MKRIYFVDGSTLEITESAYKSLMWAMDKKFVTIIDNEKEFTVNLNNITYII